MVPVAAANELLFLDLLGGYHTLSAFDGAAVIQLVVAWFYLVLV